MSNAITMGILWHLIGAASAACFYAPFKQVKKWSWETMWSVGGVVSWIILPWLISALLLPDFWAYYSSFSLSTLLPVFLFGAMWGIGNINYGLIANQFKRVHTISPLTDLYYMYTPTQNCLFHALNKWKILDFTLIWGIS